MIEINRPSGKGGGAQAGSVAKVVVADMFKGAGSGLKPGDHFAKVDDPETIWTVVRLVDFPRLPPHAELVSSAVSKRKILISEAALYDRRLYRQVSDRNDARAALAEASGKRKRRGFFASLFR